MKASTQKVFDDLVVAGLAERVGNHHEFTSFGSKVKEKLGVFGDDFPSFLKVYKFAKAEIKRTGEVEMNTKPQGAVDLGDVVSTITGNINAQLDEFTRKMNERIADLEKKVARNAVNPVTGVSNRKSVAPAADNWNMVVDDITAGHDFMKYPIKSVNPSTITATAARIFNRSVGPLEWHNVYNNEKSGGDKQDRAPRFGGPDGKAYVCSTEERDHALGGLEEKTYGFALNPSRQAQVNLKK